MSAHTRKSDTVAERYYHVEIKDHPQVHHATVFFRPYEGTWLYAVALCAHGDQFDRRLGRQIARRRWFASDGWGHLTGAGGLSTGEIETMGEGQAHLALQEPSYDLALRAAMQAARNMKKRV